MHKENYSQQPFSAPDNLRFLSSKVTAFPQKAAIQYEMAHDQQDAREINNIVSFEEYKSRREQFLDYIPKQIETTLSERFNVELSRFEYEIKNDQLYGKDMDEPFIDSIKRGRDYRKENGNPMDRSREQAEVVGFEKIQKVLLDSETPVGTMMLSISPKGAEGSSYGNNFYDVFILRQTQSGKKYIEARRYASGVGVGEYKSLLMPFVDIHVDETDAAASFLANPIAIQNTFGPENLHAYLQKNHKSMSEERFSIIDKHCAGLKKKFAESLLANPDDVDTLRREFNAILNKADEMDTLIKRDGIEVWKKITPMSNAWAVTQDILRFGEKEVRKVETGCGLSGGYEVSKNAGSTPYSVAEYGKKWNYHKGECRTCFKKDQLIGPCDICQTCEVEFDKKEAA